MCFEYLLKLAVLEASVSVEAVDRKGVTQGTLAIQLARAE